MRRLIGFALLVALTATGCGSRTQALSGETMARLKQQGVDPSLVYVVDVPGFKLAEQSLGVVGDTGFGASYTAEGGDGLAELRVDKGTFDDRLCAGTPLLNADPGAAIRCVPDGDGWYRNGGGRQDYTIVRGDHYLRLTVPEGDLDREALKKALTGAKRQSGPDEKAPPSVPSPSVTRGDLPSNGDGAPIQPTGPGG